MITPTQQIVCSKVSRQLIADLSPTSRQPVADQSQPNSNQLAINNPPVADRSPTGRPFLGIVVADQSPIDLQPKNAIFDRTVVALVAAVFLVARQSPTGSVHIFIFHWHPWNRYWFRILTVKFCSDFLNLHYKEIAKCVRQIFQ